jgi:hypothetical protein
MKPHKWEKEIKAWADGAEIEVRWFENKFSDRWYKAENPDWNTIDSEYRIKPQPSGCLACVTCGQLVEESQPKEPQYLYVYKEPKSDSFGAKQEVFITTETGLYFGCEPIGKIKLEVHDE